MNTEHALTLAALETAIQMEKDGKNYYLQLSKTGSDEAGCQLFASLAEEEDVHRQNFEEIFRVIQSGQSWPQISLGDSHAGSALGILPQNSPGNKGSTRSVLKSIQKAMDMENKTLDYYLEQLGKAVCLEEREFYKAVAAQERVHHALLLDYFEFLKDPAQYYTMKERHSLDGG